MDSVHLFLADIWFFLLGLILVLYVVLDGFDLGVGIVSLFACDERRRGIMMASLSGVWDANETWLVLLGGALFGSYPLVYGVVLHALYVPIMLMLFALIFRGVAFEFREHARRKLPWNLAFGLGSLLAALAQGFALAGILQGIPVSQGRFAGGPWDWLTPFSVLVSVGVASGYSLLGATYLIMRTEGEIQARSYRRAAVSAVVTLVVAVIVTLWTPLVHPFVAYKWFSAPYMFYIAPLPVFASFAFLMLFRALHRRRERAPFLWSLAIFVTSFVGLAISLHPFLVPPNLTLADAASSKTLVFMLTGVGMLLPIMIIYNSYQYLVFRGKVRHTHYAREEN